MGLWTDLITPAELTGYARAALEDYERSKGTLARWLPNDTVPDIVARFVTGAAGLPFFLLLMLSKILTSFILNICLRLAGSLDT